MSLRGVRPAGVRESHDPVRGLGLDGRRARAPHQRAKGAPAMNVQWVSVISLLLVLVLIGWRMRGRTMLMATCFGLAFAVLVLWLDQSGLWPQAWRR
jgi:hypothetical protein